MVMMRQLDDPFGPLARRCYRAVRVACPFVPLKPVPVACPSRAVLVVTRGHWRSTEMVSDLELDALTCTGRGSDKK